MARAHKRARRVQRRRPARSERLDVYLEPELYEWIHRKASASERSMSDWLRWVVVQLRAGLDPGTMEGNATAAVRDD